MSTHYSGSCHCGAIRFSYDGEEITSGLRCTCSICSRKGALMSPEVIPLENLQVDANPDDLGLYQFDSGIAKHYFCRKCCPERFPDRRIPLRRNGPHGT